MSGQARWRLWWPVVAWAVLIFALSHIPFLKTPFHPDRIYRKISHLVEYAVLAALLARALKGSGYAKSYWSLALGASLLFACTDEYHQTFIPGRRGSWRDVGFDFTGALAGLGLFGLAEDARGKAVRTAFPV